MTTNRSEVIRKYLHDWWKEQVNDFKDKVSKLGDYRVEFISDGYNQYESVVFKYRPTNSLAVQRYLGMLEVFSSSAYTDFCVNILEKNNINSIFAHDLLDPKYEDKGNHSGDRFYILKVDYFSPVVKDLLFSTEMFFLDRVIRTFETLNTESIYTYFPLLNSTSIMANKLIEYLLKQYVWSISWKERVNTNLREYFF